MFFFIFAYIFSQDFSDQVLTVEPTAECFCFHMFSTSFDSDKFGWFGGAGVLSFMVDPGDFFEHVDGEFLNESADFWVDCHCLLSFASERFTCLS